MLKRKSTVLPTIVLVDALKKVKRSLVLPMQTLPVVDVNQSPVGRRVKVRMGTSPKIVAFNSPAKVQPLTNLGQSTNGSVGRKIRVLKNPLANAGQSTRLPPIIGTRLTPPNSPGQVQAPTTHSYQLRFPRPEPSPLPQKKTGGGFHPISRTARAQGLTLYRDTSSTSLEKLEEDLQIKGIRLSTGKLAAVTASPGKTIILRRPNIILVGPPQGLRTPRGTPRGGKNKQKGRQPQPLDSVPGDVKERNVKLGKYPTLVRKGNLRGVMNGNSAFEHAVSVKPEYARLRFEWLHLQARSLGGPNTIANLVAGTFDANTRMTNVERHVDLRRRLLKKGEFIDYRVKAELVPGTHVASKISLHVMFPPRLKAGSVSVKLDLNPLDNTKYTNAEYLLNNRLLAKGQM